MNITKWKVLFFTLCGFVFAVIALKGVNGHFKLAFGAFLAGMTAISLENWSFIITSAWGLLQIGLLIPEYYKGIKNMMVKFFANEP